MKEIIKYQAIDGKVFNDKAECLEYDKLCERVNEIMKPFGEQIKNDGCQFVNGYGYLQQDVFAISTAKNQIIQLIEETSDFAKNGWGWLGRYLDDSGLDCLYRAWIRIECMDGSGREWGQIYYARNPSKATSQKCLNHKK